MVRPVSANTSLRSGSEYTEQEGVALRPGAHSTPASTARTAQSTNSSQARATVQEDVFETPSATSTAPQASFAAQRAVRNGDTVRMATGLLQEAARHTAGASIIVPRARTSTFEGLVDAQHSRAGREILQSTAISLTASAAGAGVGHHIEHGLHRSTQLAETVSVATTVGTDQAIRLATSHNHEHSLLETISHVALHSAVDGVLEVAFGPAGAAVSAMAQSVARTFEDAEDRTRFQQAASQYDANRATAMSNQRTNQGQGQSAAMIAATGNGVIDWPRYERDGDFAAGVRQGLSEALNRPENLLYLYAARRGNQ